MNWDRVEAARTRGRSLFAVAGLAIMVTGLLLGAGPNSTEPMFCCRQTETGIPATTLVYGIGVAGVLFGLAWMWRLYRAPTRFEGAHWRFHDH